MRFASTVEAEAVRHLAVAMISPHPVVPVLEAEPLGANRGGKMVAPARAAEPAGEPVVDAAKDKALLDAFSAAIAAAMGGAG